MTIATPGDSQLVNAWGFPMPPTQRNDRIWLPKIAGVQWGPEPIGNTADHRNAVPNGHVPYTLRGDGAKMILDVPGLADWSQKLDISWVRALLSGPTLFMEISKIVKMEEETGFADPTPMQRAALHAIHEYRWIMVDKYRQARMTTAAVLWLLRDCMYFEGLKGVVIANDDATAKMAFERIRFAYEQLPPELKIPLMPGTTGSSTEITFIHGGSIKIISAGSRAPAVGHSIDRMVITEFGEAMWQMRAAVNMFPTIGRRPRGRVWLESTPGRADSYHRSMWQSCMDGDSRFFGVFLRWWADPTCEDKAVQNMPVEQQIEVVGSPAEHETALINDGASPAALVWLRNETDTYFNKNPLLASSKYPRTPDEGWLGSLNPSLPSGIIGALIATSIARDQTHEVSGEARYLPEAPDMLGQPSAIFADPAGFGQSGDPSALFVVAPLAWTDLAYWTGREDPSLFVGRLLRVAARMAAVSLGRTSPLSEAELLALPKIQQPMICVESNATAAITLLRATGYKNLYWSALKSPGWNANEKSLRTAEATLVRTLSDGSWSIRARTVLHQLLGYDGRWRNIRVRADTDEDVAAHHFDLARCVIMAAGVMGTRTFMAFTPDGRPVLKGRSDLDPAESSPYQVPDEESDEVDWSRVGGLAAVQGIQEALQQAHSNDDAHQLTAAQVDAMIRPVKSRPVPNPYKRR